MKQFFLVLAGLLSLGTLAFADGGMNRYLVAQTSLEAEYARSTSYKLLLTPEILETLTENKLECSVFNSIKPTAIVALNRAMQPFPFSFIVSARAYLAADSARTNVTTTSSVARSQNDVSLRLTTRLGGGHFIVLQNAIFTGLSSRVLEFPDFPIVSPTDYINAESTNSGSFVCTFWPL